VGFPENELTSNEHVVLHLHPHWKQMVGPYLVLIVALAGAATGWVVLKKDSEAWMRYGISGVAVILIVWLFLIPFIKWRATHFVFTNERVITRSGVFSQHTENIPMDRVSDVVLDQSFFERILGCGKLTLASPGEHGPDQLKNIPHVKAVNVKLHELIDPEENVPAPRGSSDGTTQKLSQDS